MHLTKHFTSKAIISAAAGLAIAAGILTPFTANAATQCEPGVSTVAECVKDPVLAQDIATQAMLSGPDAVLQQSSIGRITVLTLDGQTISSLEGLEHFPELTMVQISNTGVTDLSPLSNLPKLGILEIDNDKISDFSPIAKLPALKNLSAQNSGFSDLSPLSGLKNLDVMLLKGNGITSLKPLKDHKSLRTFDVSDNNISDLSPLAGLTQLKGFEADDNNISDISAFSNFTNLEWVQLRNNHITDISPLLNAPLTTLIAQGQTTTLPTATIAQGESYTLQAPNGVQKGTFAPITMQTPEGGAYDEATGKLTFANLPVGNNAVSYTAVQNYLSQTESGAKITRRYSLKANQTVTVTKKTVTAPAPGNNADSAAVKPTVNGTTPTKLAATGSNVSVVAFLAGLAALLGAAALTLQRIKH